VAGTALLPWEEWLARLLHPIIVAVRRWSYERRHTRDLARTANWPKTEGTVHVVNADFSNLGNRSTISTLQTGATTQDHSGIGLIVLIRDKYG
jgi:hypothetical protein